MQKVKPKFHAYHIISDAVESGLFFALNRLTDLGVHISDEQRRDAIDPMLNEIMHSLSDVIIYDN